MWLFLGRTGVADRKVRREAATEQHLLSDSARQEPRALLRMGRASNGCQGNRLQHDSLHPSSRAGSVQLGILPQGSDAVEFSV